MKIKDYLFEKLYFILLGLLTYAIIVLFLYGIGNNTQAIMVVSLLYLSLIHISLGPILQGVRLPMNDLSRSASIDEIYKMAIITAMQKER